MYIPKKNFKDFHKQLISELKKGIDQCQSFQNGKSGCLRIEIDLPDLANQLWVYERDGSSLIANPYQYSSGIGKNYRILEKGASLPTDHAALATMQIAACRLAVDNGLDFCSEALSPSIPIEEAMRYGYLPIPGAICSRISYDNQPWADVYVGVVGATNSENKACAEQAIPVITDFFCDEANFMISGAQIAGIYQVSCG